MVFLEEMKDKYIFNDTKKARGYRILNEWMFQIKWHFFFSPSFINLSSFYSPLLIQTNHPWFLDDQSTYENKIAYAPSGLSLGIYRGGPAQLRLDSTQFENMRHISATE